MRFLRLIWAGLLLTAGMGAGIGLGALAEPEPVVACVEGDCLVVPVNGTAPYQAPQNETQNQTVVVDNGTVVVDNRTEEPEDEREVHECHGESYFGAAAAMFNFTVDSDVSHFDVFFELRAPPSALGPVGGSVAIQLLDGNGTTIAEAREMAPGWWQLHVTGDGIGDFTPGEWTLQAQADGLAGDWFYAVTVEY